LKENITRKKVVNGARNVKYGLMLRVLEDINIEKTMTKTRITIFFNGKYVFSEQHQNVTMKKEKNKIILEWHDKNIKTQKANNDSRNTNR
jgi:hypothetical protein